MYLFDSLICISVFFKQLPGSALSYLFMIILKLLIYDYFKVIYYHLFFFIVGGAFVMCLGKVIYIFTIN